MEHDFVRMMFLQTLQVTVLAAVIAIVARVCARNRPHLAHALWLVVLLKCVTPPIWSSPGGIFSWAAALQPAAARPYQPDEELELAATNISSGVLPTNAGLAAGWQQHADTDASQSSSHSAMPVPELSHVTSSQGRRMPLWADLPLTWRRPILLTWLAGVLGGVCLITLRSIRCWSNVCVKRVPVDPSIASLVQTLAARLHLRRRVQVLVTEAPVGPAVVGLFRSTVVLPSSLLTGSSPRNLEAIVAHELVHIRRGDLWISILQLASQVLWWFHPLVWRANRWLTQEAERCCDEEAIAALQCPPAGYARALLAILEARQTMSPIPAFPGVRPMDVTTQRLERIMSLNQGCRKRTPMWCWLVTLAAAAVSLPGAALVSEAQDDEAERLTAQEQSAVGKAGTDEVVPSLDAAKTQTSATQPTPRSQTRRQPKLAAKLSVDFKETPLRDAIRQIADRAGINLVLDSSALAEENVADDAPITLRLVDVPAATILDLVLEPLGLTYSPHQEPVLFADLLESKRRRWQTDVITITSRRRAQGELIVATYPVADLVIPIPGRRIKSDKDGEWYFDSREKGFDLTTLAELIVEIVEPDSWMERGGNATVRGYDQTLSLVIRQSRGAHEEIRDLLGQIRRLQNLQVLLDIQLLWPEKDFWDRARQPADGPARAVQLLRPENNSDHTAKSAMSSDLLQRMQQDSSVLFSEDEAKLMRNLLFSARQRTSLPKCTFFTGQAAWLAVPAEPGNDHTGPTNLQVGTVISSDRKTVRLHLGIGTNDSGETPSAMSAWNIPDGQMLMVDLGQLSRQLPPTTSEKPSAVVDTTAARKRCLLLITPKVLQQAEDVEVSEAR